MGIIIIMQPLYWVLGAAVYNYRKVTSFSEVSQHIGTCYSKQKVICCSNIQAV